VEWLRETQWLAWAGGALVLGLIEVASLDLVFIMLSVGALSAALAAFLGAGFALQVIVFVLTSAVLLLLARPLALRKLKPAGAEQRTGTAAQVGRTAEVLEPVGPRGGLVKLTGETWSARTHDVDRTFAVGDTVVVVRIDGATAVVDAPPPPPSTAPEHEEKS
jgi:membrane protein implicated in regulation of membrane protease activity